MNYSQINSILKQKAGLMILAGLLLAALTFWGIMLVSPRYQSNFDVLVIQNQEGFVDSYTLAKSTEHFAKLLSESIYMETFLNKAAEGYPQLSKILPIDREQKMKNWAKMVNTSLDVELGIIHVKVLAADRSQAENISRSIAGVLANDNSMFTSGSQKIEVRMINSPFIKNNPGLPILSAEVLAAFLIGFLLVFGLYFSKSLRRIELMKKNGGVAENARERKVTQDSFGNIIDVETGRIVSFDKK